MKNVIHCVECDYGLKLSWYHYEKVFNYSSIISPHFYTEHSGSAYDCKHCVFLVVIKSLMKPHVYKNHLHLKICCKQYENSVSVNPTL